MKYFLFTTKEPNAVDNYSDIVYADCTLEDVIREAKKFCPYEFEVAETDKPASNQYTPYLEDASFDWGVVCLHDKDGNDIIK